MLCLSSRCGGVHCKTAGERPALQRRYRRDALSNIGEIDDCTDLDLFVQLYQCSDSQQAEGRHSALSTTTMISSRASGRGAVFTADGTHEMEASIMDGSNLKVIAQSQQMGNP